MVLKRAAILTLAAFVSAGIATAGGPDVTARPKAQEAKKMKEAIIKPLEDKKEEEAKAAPMESEEAPKGVELAQPSDPRPMAPRQVVMQRVEAEKVNVLFESNPTNAELMVNGVYVGSTPIQIPLYDGVHNVKMAFPGFMGWERQVKAYEGLRVYATLEEKAGQ